MRPRLAAARGLLPALAAALVLVGVAGRSSGVSYEFARAQMRVHPEVIEFERPSSADAATRPMKTATLWRGRVLGTDAALRRFEERPVVLLEASGRESLLVALGSYGQILVQNLDLVFRPFLSPPFDARALAAVLALLYLTLVHSLVRTLLDEETARTTVWLMLGNVLFLSAFSFGDTNVASTVVLFYAGVHALVRSREGSRLWLCAGFVFLFLSLTGKITASGYLAAVCLPMLLFRGFRANLRRHRAQWLTIAAAVASSWGALLLGNRLLLEDRFYASGGKLRVNPSRALEHPLSVAAPLLHQAAVLTAWPLASAPSAGLLSRLALLAPALLFGAGLVGLVRLLLRAGARRRMLATLVAVDLVALGLAGVFYFGDVSFDLLLFSLPIAAAALAYGLLHGLAPTGVARPSRLSRALILLAPLLGLLAGGVVLLMASRAPDYGLTLGTERELLRTLRALPPRSEVLTIEPWTAYAMKYMDPSIDIVYLEGASWRLRFGDAASVTPALETLLVSRRFPVAVLPERPPWELGRPVPWGAIRTLLTRAYGAPRRVAAGAHDGVLVFGPSTPRVRQVLPSAETAAAAPRDEFSLAGLRAGVALGPLWAVRTIERGRDHVRIECVGRGGESLAFRVSLAGPKGPFDVGPVRISYETTARSFEEIRPAGEALARALVAGAGSAEGLRDAVARARAASEPSHERPL